MEHTKNKSIFLVTIPVIIFLIGLFGVVLPYIDGEALPGDIGDARFNQYVLEHFHLVISGREPSFVNAPFFYPWIKTISFSDTHWGTGFLYSSLRLTGLSPDRAFADWFLIGFVLNYWITYFVNRKLGLRQLGASIGAFLFTFSLPVIGQDSHQQLVYRACVPLAVFASYKYVGSKDPRCAALAVMLLSIQFLISVYNGLFLAYLLFGYLIAALYLAPVGQYGLERLMSYLPAKNLSRSTWISAFIILIFAAVIFLLMGVPYLQAKFLYGFGVSWSEIKTFLPRIQSYFWGDHSQLWFSIPGAFFQLEAPHEQRMFIGLGAAVVLLYGIIAKYILKQNRIILASIISISILITMTLIIGDITLYRFLILLPGVSAVRVISRIILILIFPIGLIVGYVLDRIVETDLKFVSSYAIVGILCVLILSDSVFARKSITSSPEWKGRLQQLESRITRLIEKDDILVVATGEPDYAIELDAMLLAQAKGIKTLNGYSARGPAGSMPMKTCDDVNRVISAGQNFSKSIGSKGPELDRKKLLFVGFENDCR